jgi:hypothetical protein
MIQFAIYSSASGSIVADYSNRIQGAQIATNDRGYAECNGFIPLSLAESFMLYDRTGLPHVRFSDTSSGVMYEGRLEDVELTDGGVNVTALGYARALSDTPYIAFWSTTSVGAFQGTTGSTSVAYNESERWQRDTNNRLYITLIKGNTYTLNKAAGLLMSVPYGSTQAILGMQFSLEQNLPAAFTWRAVTFGGDISLGLTGGVAQASAVGTAALVNRAYHLTFASQTTAGLDLLCNTGGAPAGETGTNYVKITNLRLVGATTNRVNTTLTANRGAGVNVTATVGATAGMYVGMQLVINSGANPSEIVTVLSIGSATQFNATFVGAYVIGNAVQGFQILADEIADDLVSAVSTLNSTQLSASTALIASPGLDLQNEVYEDQFPNDIMDYLAGIGDSAGFQWEWGVRDNQRLYFRRQGSAARTWYIDISAIDVQRLLDQMSNSIYGLYQDANGRTLRTASTSDATSIARYGVTRRQALSVSTTSATQALLQQSSALADGKDPKPRSEVVIDKVFDANGSRWPLWSVAAGDTVIIRNLAPTLSTAIDRIRVFRLSRATYDVDSDTLAIEPETPRPTLEALLAQLTAGVQRQIKVKRKT